jgi:hypothetical protein
MSKYVTEICDMGQIIRPCIDQNERFDIWTWNPNIY